MYGMKFGAAWDCIDQEDYIARTYKCGQCTFYLGGAEYNTSCEVTNNFCNKNTPACHKFIEQISFDDFLID